MEQAAPAQTQSTAQAPSSPPPASVEAPVKPSQDVDFSARFAELTKKEKAILQKQQQIKEESKRLEEYETAKKNAKLNPKAFLEAHGLTYQELTEFLLNDEKPSESTQIKTKIEMLEAQLEEEKKLRTTKEEEAKAREEEYLIGRFKSELKELASSSEDYELVSAEGESGIDLVYSVMEEYLEEHGEMMDKAKAMEQVEAYLESELKRKYQNTKKTKAWWQPEEKTKEPGAFGTWDTPTLTNTKTTAPAQSEPSSGWISDEESKRRSAEFLRKALQKG